MPNNKVIRANWYDYPQYYDLAFRDETDGEAKFLVEAFNRYFDPPVRRIFEPACGTGRLLTEMAARGFQMTGLDLNGKALGYLAKRLRRRRLSATLIEGDMTDFTLDAPFEAAVCPLNGFRHLLTESTARKHLQCVANVLCPGGLYVLGMHLIPTGDFEYSPERWRASHGKTSVHTDIRVIDYDFRKRWEMLRVNLLVRSGERQIRLRDEFPLRLYSARQFQSLLDSVPQFELLDVFDFWYDIDDPLEFDGDLVDAVFVLRKTG